MKFKQRQITFSLTIWEFLIVILYSNSGYSFQFADNTIFFVLHHCPNKRISFNTERPAVLHLKILYFPTFHSYAAITENSQFSLLIFLAFGEKFSLQFFINIEKPSWFEKRIFSSLFLEMRGIVNSIRFRNLHVKKIYKGKLAYVTKENFIGPTVKWGRVSLLGGGGSF